MKRDDRMKRKSIAAAAVSVAAIILLILLIGPLIKQQQATRTLKKVDQRLDTVQLAVVFDKRQADGVVCATQLWADQYGADLENSELHIKKALARCFYYSKMNSTVKSSLKRSGFSRNSFFYEYEDRWLEEYTLDPGEYMLCYSAVDPIHDLKIGFLVRDEEGNILYAAIDDQDGADLRATLTIEKKQKVRLCYLYLFSESLLDSFLDETGMKKAPVNMTYPADGKYEIAEIVGILEKNGNR